MSEFLKYGRKIDKIIPPTQNSDARAKNTKMRFFHHRVK